MSERIKHHSYKRRWVNQYFWRTYDQQELDLVEEESAQLRAYEFKWNAKQGTRIPVAWKNAYADASFSVIHTGNYLDFIT